MSDGHDKTREPRPAARVAATVIAACFGLAAFSIAILAGLASGNAAGSILAKAIIATIVCYPVGLVVALICQRVLDDHTAAVRAANPAPSPSDVDAVAGGIASTRDGSVEEDEEVLVV
jgi:hypothetical protein